ncbi:MAG TPA: hypothetical protein VH542_12480 [Steroidobacteraceae bacterium]|jgi:hypothetical protein
MGSSFRAAALLALVSSCALFTTGTASAQTCGERAVTSSDVDVFQNPPRFSTGVGWQGTQIEHLPSGMPIFVCREINLEFGFSTRTWVQIGYPSGNGFRYGWIPRDTLRTAMRTDGPRLLLALLALVPPANAETIETDQRWGPPPPLPADTPGGTASRESRASLSWADLGALYGPLFIAMLVGMIIKVAVDLVDTWGEPRRDDTRLRGHLRNGAIAILVSPIVFLGFLNAGDFSGARQTFLVLALLAFQNGFFWQTVLKKGER